MNVMKKGLVIAAAIAVLAVLVLLVATPAESVITPSTPTIRNYTLVITEKSIEYAPGQFFTAWVYNDSIPGPTIRANVGDTVNVTIVNKATRPHSISPHILEYDPAKDDGTSMTPQSIVQPGQSYTYTFKATRPGVGVYHCHVDNDRYALSVHVQQGLQGVVIVEDPANPLPPAKEYVVMLNEVYDRLTETIAHGCSYCAGNGKYFSLNSRQYGLPQALNLSSGKIENATARTGELVRFYVVNQGNDLHSFHIHMHELRHRDIANGNTVQVVDGDDYSMMQGDAVILETTAKAPGKYFYHCHMEVHAELGMIGVFTVTP